MARAIVSLYHDAGAGEAAERAFNEIHRDGGVPQDLEPTPIPAGAVRDGLVWLPKLLVSTGLAGSNGEARRAVHGGAVRLDGEQLTDPEAEFPPETLHGKVLQVGRRRFVRLA